MLRSMPYLTGLLLKIYDAMGKNWDRCGNVRFAVVYKPQDGELDRGAAQERAEQIAEEWSRAMQEGRNGSVRDFVSVGDVSIKAIGADNQILDSETPVRQMLDREEAMERLCPECRTRAEEARCSICGAKLGEAAGGGNASFDMARFIRMKEGRKP